jgi:GTP-binding protein
VTELLNRVQQLLNDLPPVEEVAPPPERRVYRLEENRDEDWEVDRLSRHHYEVRGPKIERTTRMTDFGNEEAASRFQRILDASGISRRLEQMGVQPGDVVHIAGMELVWDEAALQAEQIEAGQRRRKTKRERTLARLGLDEPSEELPIDER